MKTTIHQLTRTMRANGMHLARIYRSTDDSEVWIYEPIHNAQLRIVAQVEPSDEPAADGGAAQTFCPIDRRMDYSPTLEAIEAAIERDVTAGT